MKKNILGAFAFLSMFSFVSFAHAASPTVTAGANQVITLPTSSATLTGTVTPEVATPALSATQVWSLVSGPSVTPAVSFSAPTALSTTASGLTAAGVYTFKLTATDSKATPEIGSATVTVTVNAAGTVTPPTTPVYKKAHKLEINGKGQVNMQGDLTAINGSILTVKVWGMSFNVDTTGVKIDGRSKDLSTFKVGDSINVKGMIDANASTLTVKARSIKNDSIRNSKEQKGREDEWKKMKEFKKIEDGKKISENDDDDDNKGRGRGGR